MQQCHGSKQCSWESAFMEVSVHGSKQAISMLHLSILSSTIVSRFNKLHQNARKFAHCYEYIQQVVSKCTLMQPIAMSTPLQKSSVECIYIILLHRFLTSFSCSFSQKNMRQPRVQTKSYTSRCIHDNQILMVSDGDP